MNAQVEEQSLEAQIADCYRTLYCTTEPDVAMSSWTRMRQLIARKNDAELGEVMQRDPAGPAA